MELPNQFNALHYKILNLELYNLSRQELERHYVSHGHQEGREHHIPNLKIPPNLLIMLANSLIMCNYDLPSDFDVNHYKNLYNLKGNLLHIIRHYLKHKLPHRYPDEVPPEFDVESYLLANDDLRKIKKTSDVINHAKHHAESHNRVCSVSNDKVDDDFEYPELVGNCCIFINPCPELSDASGHLYDLVTRLTENKILENILVVDVCKNPNMEDAYFHLLDREPIYYYNNGDILHKYLRYYNPMFVYSNSVNIAMYETEKFRNVLSKFVFHFHETFEEFSDKFDADHVEILCDIIKNNVIYVESEDTRKDFLQRVDFTDMRVSKDGHFK